jgi:hypothetical protein
MLMYQYIKFGNIVDLVLYTYTCATLYHQQVSLQSIAGSWSTDAACIDLAFLSQLI